MASYRGLAVFDLDGTLLRGQTVCEILADALGRSSEMAAFEKLSAESDIALARVEMASWYRGMSEADLLACLGPPRWAPGVREGIAMLRDAGILVAIASVTWRFATSCFANELGVERVLATGLAADGTIEHVWPQCKARWVKDLAAEFDVPHSRTAAVGNSGGDIPMLSEVALPFFVGDTKPEEPACIHLPDGDIRRVAGEILERW